MALPPFNRNHHPLYMKHTAIILNMLLDRKAHLQLNCTSYKKVCVLTSWLMEKISFKHSFMINLWYILDARSMVYKIIKLGRECYCKFGISLIVMTFSEKYPILNLIAAMMTKQNCSWPSRKAIISS